MKRLLAAAIPIAALMFGASSAQAFGGRGSASCAAGSVDGAAPTTPMCFGTMFPQLPPFRYSDQAAADLAARMQNRKADPADTDRGTIDDSAMLPAEYTYLGQFVDHNLDFDRMPAADHRRRRELFD